jgi:hypothetical protein
MCSDGIAATWLACATSGEPHDPHVWLSRTVSTNPRSGMNRGGATGTTAKQPMPIRLTSTNVHRAQRYSAGRRRYSQASNPNAATT